MIREQLLAGTLPAAAGQTAADPEERRWGARARHSDRARPLHPAGHAAGPATAIRPDASRSTATVSGLGAARTTPCAQAQRYIQEGRRWVVDVDLEKFFDRVNHDVLMGKLAKRIADQRMLGLIRRYLEAGIMAERGGDGAARGDAARRSPVAAARERAPRRSRQGAGEARTRLRALRR